MYFNINPSTKIPQINETMHQDITLYAISKLTLNWCNATNPNTGRIRRWTNSSVYLTVCCLKVSSGNLRANFEIAKIPTTATIRISIRLQDVKSFDYSTVSPAP